MNFDEFIKNYNGKAIDYDGGYGVQCVDLAKLYMDKVLNIKIGAIGNAEAYWNRYNELSILKNNFDRIANSTSFIPQKGDIVIWGLKHGKYGHIAIADGEGTTSYFYSYDQNWNGKPMKRVKHIYKDGFEGVLRPKNQSNINNKPNIKYEVHIQNISWQKQKENGQLAGTTGEGLRIEAIKIDADIPIKYRVHMENKGDGDTGGGWSEYVPNGFLAGTIGESRRIEAIEIESSKNAIRATAHVESIGDIHYTEGTHIKIGTEGRALRLEALTLEFI